MTTWLDNAATTRPAPDVLEAMRPWQGERWGNPSSSHGPGVRAAEAVAEAAREVAALIPGGSWDVIFTSGGTEANALAVLGTGRRGGIVTTDVEHPSVLGNVALLESAGSEVARVGAGPAARVDPGRMAGAIGAGTRLVSIMHGNNEVGTLQPVAEVAAAARARAPRCTVHVDAVQTAGRIPLTDLASVDMVSLSSHKIHGPMGVGALLVRRGARRPAPLWAGGGQQQGIRSGTENVPGIVGFGVAARLAARHAGGWKDRASRLVEELERGLGDHPRCRPGFRDVPRIPGHLAMVVEGVPAEPVAHAMEQAGFIVSAGSACHSRSRRRSHVLEAVGLDEDRDVIRVVASRETTGDEMRAAGEALAGAVSRIARGR